MKKSINIIGAFDRYNYGDLLFPIIIEEYLKKYNPSICNEYELEYYGLIKSNLSNVGGKETKNLSELYNKDIVNDSLVIVSGGEVIGSQNTNLYLHLCKTYPEFYVKNIIIKGIRKLFGREILNIFFRKKFDLKSDYPWIIEPSHFNNNVHIVYNTVGGRIPKNKFDYLQDQISKALYISVRENDVRDNIALSKTRLYPDSATAMSVFFPLNILEQRVSEQTRNFVKNNPNYICIQTSLNIYKKNKDEFITQIKKIHSTSNQAKIALLPLGYASNHDDYVALKKIKKQIPNLVELIDGNTIYDMMYIIGSSVFFAGTSLHGNITAMSYGVPHIGLSMDRPKLQSYLSTWDVEGQDHCIDISKLYDYYMESKNMDTELLNTKRNELVDLVLENFREMFNKIEEIEDRDNTEHE